jgi:hypothetical protein
MRRCAPSFFSRRQTTHLHIATTLAERGHGARRRVADPTPHTQVTRAMHRLRADEESVCVLIAAWALAYLDVFERVPHAAVGAAKT